MVIAEGWLQKRGPVLGWNWQRFYCTLDEETLHCYTSPDCQEKRSDVQLGPHTKVVGFNDEGAVGDAVNHAKEKPSGFVLDVDPNLGEKRRLFYFDAEDAVRKDRWVQAISTASKRLSELSCEKVREISRLSEQLEVERKRGKEATERRSDDLKDLRRQFEVERGAREGAELEVREQRERLTEALGDMKEKLKSWEDKDIAKEVLHEVNKVIDAANADVLAPTESSLRNSSAKGTTRDQLSETLSLARKLVFETCNRPQVEALGLASPLKAAVRKLDKCQEDLARIDETTAVDVHHMVAVDGDALLVEDFILDQYTHGSNVARRSITANASCRGRARSETTSAFRGRASEKSGVGPDDPLQELEVAYLSVFSHIEDGSDTWAFSLLELNTLVPGRVLQTYGLFLLSQLCPIPLKAEEKTIATFLSKASTHYTDKNSYHNDLHAAQVCHAGTWLARHLGVEALQTELERAAFAIAALGHDLGHFGRNNHFCVNTEHEVALKYNNKSVLEHMHTAKCMELLQDVDGVNMLATLSRTDRMHFRTVIIDTILATDTADHFESLSKFKAKIASQDFSLNQQADRNFATSMCIKAADIGHSALPWDIHEAWSYRVAKEFFEQGDEERTMGIPVSPLCDRGSLAEFCKSQKGFLSFVCAPLYDALGEHELKYKRQERQDEDQSSDDPPLSDIKDTCVMLLMANAQQWVEDASLPAKVKQNLEIPEKLK